ncbi:UNVERIFIED_CONTAM: hypothetical protein GTU68_016857, partial [Idotea baltica]|nr:hypothetical protein [Idotea baltica]
DSCSTIWEQLTEQGADRSSLLINLGGGVIGDMGGFAASTYMRGIDFIQLPTTLLSQVDASVGGKLGVDFMDFKNMIGLFKNPKAVIIDPYFLNTLDKRQIRSGFAEMIKHAIIADQRMLSRLVQIDPNQFFDWAEYIEASIEIKKKIVTQDWQEKGIRKILNFGHTLGHAIESNALSKENPLLHGEAIAIGMLLELHIAVNILEFPLQKFRKIAKYLIKIYGKSPIAELDTKRILALMKKDKKNHNEEIRFALVNEVGEPNIDVVPDTITILEALKYYRNL